MEIIANGIFIPKTCQWIGDENSETCNHRVLKDKSYCFDHYHRVYDTNIDENDIDKAVEEACKILGIEDDEED